MVEPVGEKQNRAGCYNVLHEAVECFAVRVI